MFRLISAIIVYVNDDEISTSPRGLGIYIRLFNKEVVKT